MSCAVCGWDFSRAYGSWGAGYAEVHHLVPLGEEPVVRETDAEHDLAVLCANCHRMVHRRRSLVLSIDELRSKLDVKSILDWAQKIAKRNQG